MSLRAKTTGISILFFAMHCLLSGCASSLYNLKWLVTEGTNYDGNLDYYVDQATHISYPDVFQKTDERVFASGAPRLLRSPNKDEVWDLHLESAIRLALKNSAFIRNRSDFLSPGNSILNNPNFSASTYDTALQDTSVVTGRRGVDAALADFDGRLINTMTWGRNETVQNNRFTSGGLNPGDVLTDETFQANTNYSKQIADGSVFSIVNDWNYSLNNIPSRLFGSVYTGSLRFNYTRPLWAASGTKFTRIAGHPGRNATTALNVDNGVVIARINSDISVADFEAAVSIMLRDVETLYWDLYFAYQTYHSEVKARDRAARVWSKIKAMLDEETIGLAPEAQARDNYYDAKDRAQNALADIYSTEQQLRRLLGLPVNDGKIIRPADALQTNELIPDWDASLIEALTSRVELRRQKWNIKSLELQLEAARSLTKPRFDAILDYGLNAFGDRFLDSSDNDGFTREGLGSAVGTLTQGSHTRWQAGFQFSVPIGFRQAWSQVRNIELRLRKARRGLSEQELEISHELSSAIQQIDRWYASAKVTFNRQLAAKERLESFEALLEDSTNPAGDLDATVRAQFSLSQAQIAYLRSVTEYNKAITELYYRKGAITRRFNVTLEEGEWDPQAYQDVLRRAWSRTHAFDEESTLRTEPLEFSLDRSSPIEIPNTIDPENEMNFDNSGKILPPAPTIKETQLEIESNSLRNRENQTKTTTNAEFYSTQENRENVSNPLTFPRQPNYNVKTKQYTSQPMWQKKLETRNQSPRRWDVPTFPKPANYNR